MRSRLLMTTALALVAACGDAETVDLGGDYMLSVSVPPLERRAIDLLFVIDDSGSTQPDTDRIAAGVRATLFDVIEASVGGPPDLHVGVTSTSMAIAGDLDSCGPGKDGRLVVAPQFPECGTPTGMFLSDVAGPGGARERNFDGTLADALTCILPRDGQGCGLEMPLAAAMNAVSGVHPENAGFLRPDALLVVVFVTDEDDCSVIDQGLFAIDDRAVALLGPLTSYRCFEQMVVCDQPLSSDGVKTGCGPWAASPYALPLTAAADALIAAKGGDPSLVFVATITGGVTPVRVETNVDGRLALQYSCGVDELLGSYPAIRMDAFRTLFPARNWSESLCEEDLTPAMRNTGEYVGDLASRRGCLRGAIADDDPATAGIQPRCVVYAGAAMTRDAGESRLLPSCEASGSGTCARIVADGAACGHTGLGLRVEVDPRGESLVGLHTIVECKSR